MAQKRSNQDEERMLRIVHELHKWEVGHMDIDSQKRICDLFKETLNRSDDGRLHGREKEKANVFRAVLKHDRLRVRGCTAEEFLHDALFIDFRESDFRFALEKILPLSQSSVSVQRLLQSRLSSIFGQTQLRNGNAQEAAIALAAAYRLEGSTVQWESTTLPKALKAFNDLAQDSSIDVCVRADAFLVSAFLSFTINDHKDGLIKLHRAQKLQPHDSSLHNIEGCIQAMLLNKMRALESFKRAKALGSTDIQHTLFHRAVMETSEAESKKFFEEFVELAERDDRKLCEAYYRLVDLYANGKPRLFGAARRFYDKGLVAENDRLLIYGNDEAVRWRISAEALVGKFHACGMVCPNAGTSKCSRCKSVFYCSKSCQQADWPSHKQKCFGKSNNQNNETASKGGDEEMG